MIGAVVYRGRAVNSAWLPLVHGRFMHAAFFAMLREYSPKLSQYVHDCLNIKPFTVSELKILGKKSECVQGAWHILPETQLEWRVTALNDMLLQALAAIPDGYVLQAGKLQVRLENKLLCEAEHPAAGILDENVLMAECLAVSSLQHIEFHFLSPVSFRSFDSDFPLPLPDFIFGSLADKWNQADMPLQLDVNQIKERAASMLPLEWQGRSRQLYFDRHHGVLGFEGRFCYALKSMPQEVQQLFLMLARFAEFSGVGRLTGQGLGQTRIAYK